ncbi:hypothetical protein RclHR1_00220044 [Rhizophagus clarus]|uniref:Uncharacterized protein n=1 Tax=Rhizophagus clarus TaxID=94130 RepID=A0A2Z6QUA7_9GLOM|nr:hypothetical protein RclHR1_00220044 [Rhizophagus clarus]GES84587.1 hypothetical protein RCL_e8787_RclHR1_00220044 [Rhizophagus clarus]
MNNYFDIPNLNLYRTSYEWFSHCYLISRVTFYSSKLSFILRQKGIFLNWRSLNARKDSIPDTAISPFPMRSGEVGEKVACVCLCGFFLNIVSA